MFRTAIAKWRGNKTSGEGSVSTESGVLKDVFYSFGASPNVDPCTSPGEMLAAAAASCMAAMVSLEVAELGEVAREIEVQTELRVEEIDGRWTVVEGHLDVVAHDALIPDRLFNRAVERAQRDCLVTRALNIPISISTKVLVPDRAGI
jgi:osmotically inducible protein OsmC